MRKHTGVVCGAVGIVGRDKKEMGLWDGRHCRKGYERNGFVGQLTL